MLHGCFNEARALCAGSQEPAWTFDAQAGCFNEARALCAGSDEDPMEQPGDEPASMRPAHCAREAFAPLIDTPLPPTRLQ